MARRSVVTVAAGAMLTFGPTGCGDKVDPASPAPAGTIPEAAAPEAVPPEPEPEPEPEPSKPPPLPTWDEVGSGHPVGATNPPIPELVVTTDGRCFKDWVPGMIAGRSEGDRVEACAPADDCGTPIQCPERAAELLEKARVQP